MNNNTKPTKEQMYQWYVVEKKSFRQIMKIIGTKNNRKIPKLLKEYNIPIRRGSEAVKTQWINNVERKEKQSKLLSGKVKGRPSKRRIPLTELRRRYEKQNIIVHGKFIVDGLTYLNCECGVCGYKFDKSLGNSSRGCLKCGIKKSTDYHRKSFDEVKETFDKYGLVLLDDKYVNTKTPLAFICPEHASIGIQKRALDNIKKTNGCTYCKMERNQKEKKMSDRDKLKVYLKEWREAVYKRDNYTCQSCGDNKGGNLHAHHINNFSTHKHLRLDIDNGITLCESCHNPSIEGSFHYIYGTKNNNREQLEEYINKKKALI